jgi:hypothetical protein
MYVPFPENIFSISCNHAMRGETVDQRDSSDKNPILRYFVL